MSQIASTDTKRFIKDTTRRLIVRDGIVDFSMRKLATETQRSLGTIYYYYPSKSNLIIEIVDELWEECFDNLDLSKCTDFLSAIETAYSSILHYFLQFKHNWMRELSALPVHDRQHGKQSMQDYMVVIRRMLGDLVDRYRASLSSSALQKLGTQGAIDFLFINFMAYMRDGQSDIRNLLFTIERVLL